MNDQNYWDLRVVVNDRFNFVTENHQTTNTSMLDKNLHELAFFKNIIRGEI